MLKRTFLASLMVMLAAPAAWAQSQWPHKPVKFILSQPAGSGPDNVARLLGERLGKQWGQSVVIDNKPGGQNTIGAQAAAKAPADGYSFYFATAAALVTNSYLFKHLPYDPLKDFVPVTFIARSPFGILVRADSPVHSVDDLIARSKEMGGQYTLGNEGGRTFGGMITRLFNARSKANANLIAYSSNGASVQDLLGGHVQAIVADVASTAALVKQGRLRLLAVTSSRPVPGFESIPRLADLLPGLDLVGWFALVAPSGTPQTVIDRVSKDVSAVLSDPEIVQRMATLGPIAEPGWTPERLATFLREEHARWGALAKEIDVLPE
ncbi:tripartite tricarboxylate transporter substrate binding protein [Acidovorax sp. Root402]|uniref:Bug family tripartite tricarboxylate transporter substrate binding protein n=1 Tax=Acidovorax sp. Root402 TaxID=1736527 RepID=UPI0009EA0CA8|nr:tripartite tricarboxylate transporter substrate binding protein [Acidovorax sp. Root402]